MSADLVAGVGPLLTESISDAMRGFRHAAPPVVEICPGLRDWDDVATPEKPPARRQILLLGRAEDMATKGIDIAAEAVTRAVTRFAGDPGDPPVLVVRGVPDASADDVRARLDAIAAPATQIVLRPYVSDEDALRRDIWQSRVLIMPSRHEGFGLVAWEAIAAGIPVLVSRESGLARLLHQMVSDGERSTPREILPVSGDVTEIAEIWGDAIYEKLVDPTAAFQRAADVRRQLAASIGWSEAVRRLLDSLGLAREDPADGAASGQLSST
ncbi:MAG TPA: glycosyltransferase [Conexibacter sp.]|jgi:glycosyltransferase involved in cell wall biosynthesis|nr:glycosyltransferase [Conexibacter sp.]